MVTSNLFVSVHGTLQPKQPCVKASLVCDYNQCPDFYKFSFDKTVS